ncbi:MAG: DUF1499 domain-containing protein [Casimicrobiaceae bacterium]
MRRSTALAFLAILPETAMAALFGNLFSGAAPSTLGLRDGTLAPCPDRPNCVSSRQHDASHAVEPFAYTGDATAAMARLAAQIETQEGASIVTQRADYLHAEYRSRIMGFVDDLELQADAAAHVIHVRSASRVGYGDLGVNRARVEALRAALAAGKR